MGVGKGSNRVAYAILVDLLAFVGQCGAIDQREYLALLFNGKPHESLEANWVQPQAVGKLLKVVVGVTGVDAKALRLEIILE